MGYVPSLLEHCVDTIANKIDTYKSLGGLPEELVCILFEVRGKPHDAAAGGWASSKLLLLRNTLSCAGSISYNVISPWCRACCNGAS